MFVFKINNKTTLHALQTKILKCGVWRLEMVVFNLIK